MPLKKGTSKKTQSSNIKELMDAKPGKSRSKAIKTIQNKTGMSKRKAMQKQAIAISYAVKKKSK